MILGDKAVKGVRLGSQAITSVRLSETEVWSPADSTPVGVPNYISEMHDGFVTNLEGLTPWTTDGVDADSGKVTSWASMNGIIGTMAPTGSADVEFNAVAPRDVALEGGWQVPSPPATDGTTTGVLLVFRYDSAGSYLRLLKNSTGHRFYVNIGGHDLFLEGGGVSPVCRWNMENAGDPLKTDTGGKDAVWMVMGMLWDDTPGSLKVFLNGHELTLLSGTVPTAPPVFDRNDTEAFFDGFIGDWIYYRSANPTDMEAHTAEAFTRWNTPPAAPTGSEGAYLAALPGMLAVFSAGESRVWDDNTGTTLAVIDGPIGRVENLVDEARSFAQGTPGDALRADGIIESVNDATNASMYTTDLGATFADATFGVAALFRLTSDNAGNRALSLGTPDWNGFIKTDICGPSSPFTPDRIFPQYWGENDLFDWSPESADHMWHVLTALKTRGTLEYRIDGITKAVRATNSPPDATNCRAMLWFADYQFFGQYAMAAFTERGREIRAIETVMMARRETLNQSLA